MSEKKKLKMVSSTLASTTAQAALGATPDSEVRTVAKRRQFNAAYKLAVEAADRCAEPGAIGALLRREGLYSSHLTVWRRERAAGALAALARRRGRKATLSVEQQRLAGLQAENARLKHALEQARTIIEVQKKLSTLLGLPTAASVENIGRES